MLWLLFKKLNTELLRAPSIPLAGMYPKELKKGAQTDTNPEGSIIAAKRWKPPKCPSTDKWINKMSYTQWDLLSLKKE